MKERCIVRKEKEIMVPKELGVCLSRNRCAVDMSKSVDV
jgi:hypothetical protein